MNDLFQNNGATFSECRKYRYALWRIWDDTKPLVMFIGLNPSTANESGNDPTIRRVMRFANDLGFGGVYMMNLFAFVTAYPHELSASEDPVGRENDYHLAKIYEKCGDVIACWGSFKEAQDRSSQILKMFIRMKALAINTNGSPRHPLYVKADIVPVDFPTTQFKSTL